MATSTQASDKARRKMEKFEDIRSDYRKGVSIQKLAKKYHVHRRTVREAIDNPQPPARKQPQREKPVIGPWIPLIDEWLDDDLKAHHKQRHTATRIHNRLVAEHGAKIALRTVSKYVAKRKAEIGAANKEVFVVQEHLPGDEGEVDFGDFYFYLDGVYTKAALFELRLSSSGKPFHQAYSTTGAEAFLEGHVNAFERAGGVPATIRYDNLKPAVTRVLMGRDRAENERFLLLRSHYGFDSFFCRPGKVGAHEKGGVEGGIGYFRRNYLTPEPWVESMAELNQLIEEADEAENNRVIAGRCQTIGYDLEEEIPYLQPLPAERFDAAVLLSAKVDSHSRVSVRQCFYSVPVYLVGKRVDIKLGAATVEILDGAKTVATHERAIARNTQVLKLDHYLEVLVKKPGALRGSVALSQAKASGAFTTAHQNYWNALMEVRGDKPGTLAFIEVLLAHRNLQTDSLIAAMELAVESGALDPQSVIIDARNVQSGPIAPVIPIETVAKYDRPTPTLDHYDNLLPSRKIS